MGFSTAQGSTLTTTIANTTLLNVNHGVYSTLLGSSINASTLVASTLTFSTAQGSSFVTATAVIQSTLLGSTVNTVNIGVSTLASNMLTANTVISNSTLLGSTINTVNIGVSTLASNMLTARTVTGSTINTINLTYSTLQGSAITSNTIAVSTLNASSIQTISIGYSTMNGSTITANTVRVAGLLTSEIVGIGMTNPSYALQASTLQTVNLSGNYIQDWTTVFSSSDSTAFTPTFNGTQTGPSGSPLAMNVTLGVSTNAILTFTNSVIPGNVYQLTLTAKMTGTSPYFILCDHVANDVQIAGTTQQALSGTYASYIVTFTAPSGSFSLSCISQSGTIFSYYGVQLRAFVNQMIGGLGIGTTNPSFSLHVPKGSIQAYNFQQFEWINTQSNNRIGYSPATSAGLYKVATIGTTATGYGTINVRGQIGGFSNSNTMYVDLVIMSRAGLTVWGTVYGNQTSAALQCDIVYSLNANSQYDIYIYIKSATYIVYDLVVSGASGSNILYDPATMAMVPLGALTPVSISAMANIYSYGGNVGIGKTTPGYALEVNGTINASQFLQNGASIVTPWISSGSNIYYSLGNVGIGTAIPTASLHIRTATSAMRITGNLTSASTRPAITTIPGAYEIRGSGAGDGNDDGFIRLSAGGGNSATAQAYIDLSGYSQVNDMNASVVFGTAGTERMRITLDGKVGIGMVPTALLQLNTDSAIKPGGGVWSAPSDERLKENIVLADVDRCVEIIRSLPLKHYRWKDTAFSSEQIKDRSKLGWIAQDVEKVFPNAVGHHRFAYNQVYKDVIKEDGSTEKKLVSEDVMEDCRMFNADQMYAVMYGAIQKLIAVNDALLLRVDALERKS
jgi:hypothetical protein